MLIEEDITSLIYERHLPTSRTNHQLLTEWLNQSSMTPNEYDQAWWDEFEKELGNNRLRLHRLSDDTILRFRYEHYHCTA